MCNKNVCFQLPERATPERPHTHPSSSDLRCVLSLFCQPRLFIVIIYSFRYFRHPLILLFMNPPHTGRRATLTIVSALLLCGLRRLERKSIEIWVFRSTSRSRKGFYLPSTLACKNRFNGVDAPINRLVGLVLGHLINNLRMQ